MFVVLSRVCGICLASDADVRDVGLMASFPVYMPDSRVGVF